MTTAIAAAFLPMLTIMRDAAKLTNPIIGFIISKVVYIVGFWLIIGNLLVISGDLKLF